jgi:hypothetical protein
MHEREREKEDDKIECECEEQKMNQFGEERETAKAANKGRGVERERKVEGGGRIMSGSRERRDGGERCGCVGGDAMEQFRPAIIYCRATKRPHARIAAYRIIDGSDAVANAPHSGHPMSFPPPVDEPLAPPSPPPDDALPVLLDEDV